MDDSVGRLAKQLGVQESAEILQTVAKTIQRSTCRTFSCARCSKKFKIPNAKQTALYKCVNCKSVMAESLAEEGGTAELVLDEAFPKEVQEAMRNSDKVFGRFVLLEKLGEGAMGEVHRAFDVELGRFVALKFLKGTSGVQYEARTLASLEHKNIARIYDIGIHNAKGFIAMQLIEGKHFAEVRLSQKEKIEIMRVVCEAVDFANKRGIIHRDIKPDNIMVDNDGNIFVMDFGLAIRGEREGEIAGTPGYMAPEITDGKSATPQSDVYSLAATLYHLISNFPPFPFSSDTTFQSAVEKIKRGDFVPIRKAFPAVSKELEAIINKGMQTKPEDRYQSASEMAQDLRRLQMGYPVAAFGASITYKVRKSILRNRLVAGAAMLGIAGAIVAGVVAYSRYEENRHIEKENVVAQKEKRKAIEHTRQIMDAVLRDLRKGHEEALERRREGEPLATLALIPKRILDSPFYKEVKSEAEGDAEVRYSLGRLYRIIGNDAGALQNQRVALALNPTHGLALYELAVLTHKKYKAAVDALRDTWRTKESARLSKMTRAQRAGAKLAEPSDTELEGTAARKLHAEMEKLFLAAVENLPKDSVESMTASGIIAYANSKSSDAREFFKRALGKDKSFEEAVRFMALISDRTQALETLSAAIAEDKGNTASYELRAEVLETIGYGKFTYSVEAPQEYLKAIEDWDAVLKLQPQNQNALLRRARLWNSYGTFKYFAGGNPTDEYNKALRDLDALVAMNAASFEGYKLRGNVHEGFGNYYWGGWYRVDTGIDANPPYEKAMADYRKAADLNSTNAYIYISLSGCCMNWANYLKMKDNMKSFRLYQEGVGHCNRAIELDGNEADYYSRRASIWTNVGIWRTEHPDLDEKHGDPTDDYKAALPDCNKAVQLDPSNYDVWMARGMLLCNIGVLKMRQRRDASEELELAERDLDQATKINPGFPQLWNVRGMNHANMGMMYERKQELQKAAEKYEAAIEDVETSIKLNPSLKDRETERLNNLKSHAVELRKVVGSEKDY